jgi:hypothetical protein
MIGPSMTWVCEAERLASHVSASVVAPFWSLPRQWKTERRDRQHGDLKHWRAPHWPSPAGSITT